MKLAKWDLAHITQRMTAPLLTQILFAEVGPHMGQLQATIARSGPHPVHLPLAMPAVSQNCRLDARCGPDPSAMWDVGPRHKTLQFH